MQGVSARPSRKEMKDEAARLSKSTRLGTLDILPEDVVLRQHKIKSEVKKGNVEHILPLVAGKARATLEHIPPHARVWFDLEDLIAEGVGHASTVVMKAHSSRKAAGYVTYLYKSLDNLYKDKLKEAYAEKRFVRSIYSMDSTTILSRSGKEMLLKDFLCHRRDRYTADEEKLIQRIDAERAFLRLYSRSSTRLKKYLIMWLLQPTPPKFKFYGNKFHSAKNEFKDLTPATLIGPEHCRCIWRDLECRRNIARALCRQFRTARQKRNVGQMVSLKEAIEGLLVGIVSEQ